MSKETVFFVYLLERFAQYKDKFSYEILDQWNELGITDLIYDMYEIYHCERLQNAFDDIDALVKEKQAELV
ncbi:MAG: DUF3791 domain-containing protein [Spirochaetaceae bacterium]|nr:DUF3791 domain-containing protein [Spirochaetaceae bacterium]MBR3812954.1 DUF3791 domain-containing protein [Spirochaetaceae bacterium]MDD6487509.1 DUF3791 domain-containing protein [Spirochaetales bacterium]